jgi:hypothetical protein
MKWMSASEQLRNANEAAEPEGRTAPPPKEDGKCRDENEGKSIARCGAMPWCTCLAPGGATAVILAGKWHGSHSKITVWIHKGLAANASQ